VKNKLLVVEDDLDIREILEEVLVAEGYAVQVASNGQEALDSLRAAVELPNLILLDLMMPVKDGLAFREEQAQDPLLSALPIVIMSADAHIEEKRRRMQVPVAIKKPFDIELLLRVVAQNVR
jgi:two-component system, chemotaxis family, chemotaxis protein CheY